MAPLANSSLGYFLLILCFISHQFHPITINASIPSKGFSLKLIHRDSIESPLYPGNLTNLLKLKRLVLFSESRALYLNSIVANYSSSTKNQTPIVHPNLIQPKVTPSMNNLLHLVQLGIGPSKPYYLALDTGSDLIWTQCKPCEPCFPQHGTPTFDPTQSKTFEPLSCPHRLCTPPDYKCTNEKCVYDIQYTEGYSKGYLGMEKLTFDSKDKVESFLTNIIFGCNNNASHDLKFVGDIDGVLGMSKGGFSLISQMGVESTHKQFSYCFIEMTKYPNAHSYLSFGSDIRLQGNVQSTPFVSLLQQPNWYGLKLLDISVANKRLNFGPGTFDELHRTGGCFIDSGSSFTNIAKGPYETFKRAIIKYFGSKFEPIKPSEGAPDYLDLCFKIPRLTELPEVTFHFAEGANLVMKPNSVFRLFRPLGTTDQYGYYCLIILPNTKKNKLTVIGELQQVDIRFLYDLSRQRLSWVPEDCHSHP